jgi:hypothetical protein
MTLDELKGLLAHGNEDVIYNSICDGTFDSVIAGMRSICGCSQGAKKHLEGDVARHTAKVVSNLIKLSSDDTEVKFDTIDLLAALMHDVEKVTSRSEDVQGNISFPGHELKAANRVPEVARKLGLNDDQEKKLDFLVREHGVAHSLPTAEKDVQQRLLRSVFWRNLRLFQKADAVSCYLSADSTSHLPVHWDLFDRLREM